MGHLKNEEHVLVTHKCICTAHIQFEECKIVVFPGRPMYYKFEGLFLSKIHE